MTVVESLGSHDSETHSGSRADVVWLVDLLGPISPELVLVDPQLAAHARALLPDAGTTRPPPRRERETPAPGHASSAPNTRTIPWRLVGACAAVAALAASAGFGVWTTVVRHGGDSSQQPSAAAAPMFFSTPPTEPDLSPDAIAALEQEVRLKPRSALAREALGTAYLRLRRWEGAEAEFRLLIALSPSDDFAHYALGRALARQGRQWEAGRQFKLAESFSAVGTPPADLPSG